MNNLLLIGTLLLTLNLFSVSAQRITVASYNIRTTTQIDSIEGNGWNQRKQPLFDLIRYSELDIFGVQEARPVQIADFVKYLPEYGYVGVGRSGGDKGEYSAIFYRKDRFKVLEEETFWLSEDTETPNKGWDGAYPRICTWAKFQDKQKKRKFYFFNTHLDHVGVEAQNKGAALIVDRIKDFAAKEAVVLTGDFNVDQDSETYRIVNESGVLKDSHELSPLLLQPNGTYNNFDIKQQSHSRIDHVFVSKKFKVLKYGVLTNIYWQLKEDGTYVPRIPSDHYPVVVNLEYR